MNAITTTITTSRDECVSNDIALRNDCIIEMLDDLRPMLFNLARKHELEFDDCLQEASLILLEKYARFAEIGTMAYVCAAVRNEVVRRLCRMWTFSLDVPPTADSDVTYADMLAAPDNRIQQNEKVEKIVHTALRTCNLQEQQFARDEYGLETFKPLLTNWREKPATYPRLDLLYKQKDYFKAAVHAALKTNPHVLKLIQRETCVL